MNNILLCDVETSGVAPDSAILEIGAILYSVKHRSVLAQMSCLLPSESNPAEKVNGLSVELLKDAPWGVWANNFLASLFERADAVCAWNVEFDKGFIVREWPELADKVWFDAMDCHYPNHSDSRSLVNVALAHGVGVLSAHRALTDCDIMARLFTALGDRLEASIEHALRPQALFQSLAPYEDKDLVARHGFRWTGDKLTGWRRKLAIEDAATLPFQVRQV